MVNCKFIDHCQSFQISSRVTYSIKVDPSYLLFLKYSLRIFNKHMFNSVQVEIRCDYLKTLYFIVVSGVFPLFF